MHKFLVNSVTSMQQLKCVTGAFVILKVCIYSGTQELIAFSVQKQVVFVTEFHGFPPGIFMTVNSDEAVNASFHILLYSLFANRVIL